MFGWPSHWKDCKGVHVRRQGLQAKQRDAFKLVLKRKPGGVARVYCNFNGVGSTQLQTGG